MVENKHGDAIQKHVSNLSRYFKDSSPSISKSVWWKALVSTHQSFVDVDVDVDVGKSGYLDGRSLPCPVFMLSIDGGDPGDNSMGQQVSRILLVLSSVRVDKQRCGEAESWGK